jgi:hypothetical protein
MYFSLNKQLDDEEGLFECRMHFMRTTCYEVKVFFVWFVVSSLNLKTLR